MDAPNRPRGNKDPAELAHKRSLLQDPHVAPLSAFVSRLRERRGVDRVPDFDPTEAGVTARILLLLEAPGPKATVERGGSGFASPDNNDVTADNMWHLLREAGIDRRREIVTWNIVPWYIGDDRTIRGASAADILEARPALVELLALLPSLKVVVLIGRAAARGWSHLDIQTPTLVAPHPSPRNLNSRPWQRQDILATLREAIRLAGIA